MFKTNSHLRIFFILALSFLFSAVSLPILLKRQVSGDLSAWKKASYSLSTPRSRISGASAGQKIIFAGGFTDENKASAAIDIYDTVTGLSSVAELSSPRSEIGSGSFLKNRYAVFAGGIGEGATPSSEIDIYDSVTNTWTTKQLSAARINPRVLDLGDTLVIYGGVTLKAPYISRSVDVFDKDFNLSSSTEPVLAFPQFGIGASNPESAKAVVFGGYENQDPNSRFSKLEASNQTLVVNVSDEGDVVSFSAGPDLPSPRWEPSGAYANSQFILAGGYTIGDDRKNIPSADIDVFGESTLAWSNGSLKLSEARYSIYAGTIGDYVLFWGGSGSNVLDVYNSKGRKMVEAVPTSLFMQNPRSDAGYTSSDGCIFAVGGGIDSSSSSASNIVEMINACL